MGRGRWRRVPAGEDEATKAADQLHPDSVRERERARKRRGNKRASVSDIRVKQNTDGREEETRPNELTLPEGTRQLSCICRENGKVCLGCAQSPPAPPPPHAPSAVSSAAEKKTL